MDEWLPRGHGRGEQGVTPGGYSFPWGDEKALKYTEVMLPHRARAEGH